MTKKLKKLLSMVLICTMLASLGCAFSVYAEEGFSLSLLADGANIPVGMKAILNAQSLPSDASAIEVYNALGNKVGEAVVSDGAATVECIITDDDNTFTAKATDADGAVIAQSNSLEVKGWREKITETRWDIDFSSHTVGAHRWGAPYVQINDSTGNAASSSGDTLTAHAGSAANTIATEDTGVASHGVAMKMAAADNAEVQLNEFYAKPSGEVIKYEFDYKIDTIPAEHDNYGISVMRPVLEGNNWLGELVIDIDGDKVYFSNRIDRYPLELGSWYNIKAYADIKKAKLAYYINDALFCTYDIGGSSTKGEKIVSKMANAAGTVLWIDNFKVEALLMSYGVPAFSIGADVSGKLIPAGMAVNTDATLLPENASTVKYYHLDENGEIVKTLGTAAVNDLAATFSCKLSRGENRIYAEAFDASGNLAGKSNIITVNGCYEETRGVRWDIDFSSHSVGAHRWGAPYVQINDSTGNAASSSGDTLTAHAGSAANTIASVDTGDADYGVAMKLAAADANQVQLNEFGATPTGNVIKYEIDYQLITLPTANNGTATINVLQAVLNNGNWVGSLNLNANGSVLEFVGGGKTLAAELGKWYNIKAYADVVNCVMLYYIDDVYFASTSFGSGATGGTKVVSMLANAAGASCYIDNFKVSAVDVSVNPPVVGLKALSESDMTFGGKSAMLTISDLPSSASYTVVYNSDANGNLVSELENTTGTEVSAKLAYGDNYFVAVAYNSDGEIAGRSDVINVIGYVENVISSRWDIDFSAHSVAAHRWGAPYWQINDNTTGGAATSSGDSLTAHAGSANNIIASEDTGDADHGVAMKLYAYDNEQVQLNEFGATPTGDVIKYEYDYKLDSLPTNRDGSATINVMQPVMAGSVWLTSLDIGTDKPNAYFKLGSATLDVELGKWYNIRCYVDTANDVQIYYIDDVCFAVKSISPDITTGQKIVSKLQNAAGAVAWIDNFKVQVVTTSVAKLELADVTYTVDGSEVDAPIAGNLSVSAIVNNDGNARDIILFAATYEGNKLSGVQLAKHSFKDGELIFTPDALDLGAVSADENVKVMLWSDDLAPLDADELINE